jgi:predicted ester cyclase
MPGIRELVEEHYRNINNAAWDREHDVFTADVVTTVPGAPPMVGVEAFLGFSRAFFTAFPDGRLECRLMAVDGDRLLAEGVHIGTHTGPMAGPGGEVPPTGRRLELPFCDVFEARDGRISAHRVYFDQAVIAEQLGLTAEAVAAG